MRHLMMLSGAYLLCLAAGVAAITSPAFASAPTVTLSGFASNSHGTPDSDTFNATVSATLSNGAASGSLQVTDPLAGSWGGAYAFEGKVTCMRVNGARVAVGAFGTTRSWAIVEEGKRAEFTSFHSVDFLDVEFGEFPNGFEEFGEPLTFSYAGMLGGTGAPSNRPPNCGNASFREPVFGSHQSGSAIHISPSITSPKDGQVSRGSLKLSGSGEPKRAISVYERGHEAAGSTVVANASGEWSLAVTGLSPGVHVFRASSVEGSPIPSNTVTVTVKA